jgi:pimeloyl-ACP methyl ester carboxylesterase
MARPAMILNAIDAGQGDPPLVLLHGLFGSARNFGTVQRAFARQWRTIALDLRNHGSSPHGADMRYATMAADVTRTLEALGALPAVLLGHSMGGKAAMQAALAQPELVARLIVADIAPVPNPPSLLATAEAMATLPLAAGVTRANADAALSAAVPEAEVRAFLLQNLQPGAKPGWRIGLAEIIAAFADIQAWDASADARYAGPTLFIAGAGSDYIRPEHRPLIRSWFPHARFVTLKHAGHWLHADNPEGFVAVVEAFLARAG